MNGDSKESASSTPPLPIGVTVLCLTALGYAVAYTFQFSYLKFFGINFKLIDISPQSIVIAVIMTFIAYGVATTGLKTAFQVSRSVDKSVVGAIFARYISTGAILSAIIFSVLAGLGVDLLPSILAAVCIVLFIVISTNIEAIIWIVKRKNVKKGFIDFHDDVAKMYRKQGDTYIDMYAEYIMVAVLILALGLLCGRFFAIIDSTHLPVIEDDKYARLLIQRSGNTIIAKGYDEHNHKLIDGYILMNLDGTAPINISRKLDISQK